MCSFGQSCTDIWTGRCSAVPIFVSSLSRHKHFERSTVCAHWNSLIVSFLVLELCDRKHSSSARICVAGGMCTLTAFTGDHPTRSGGSILVFVQHVLVGAAFQGEPVHAKQPTTMQRFTKRHRQAMRNVMQSLFSPFLATPRNTAPPTFSAVGFFLLSEGLPSLCLQLGFCGRRVRVLACAFTSPEVKFL